MGKHPIQDVVFQPNEGHVIAKINGIFVWSWYASSSVSYRTVQPNARRAIRPETGRYSWLSGAAVSTTYKVFYWEVNISKERRRLRKRKSYQGQPNGWQRIDN